MDLTDSDAKAAHARLLAGVAVLDPLTIQMLSMLVIYEKEQWRMFESIDRVYVNAAARRDLGWQQRNILMIRFEFLMMIAAFAVAVGMTEIVGGNSRLVSPNC